jgi:hypothetical protein
MLCVKHAGNWAAVVAESASLLKLYTRQGQHMTPLQKIANIQI